MDENDPTQKAIFEFLFYFTRLCTELPDLDFHSIQALYRIQCIDKTSKLGFYHYMGSPDMVYFHVWAYVKGTKFNVQQRYSLSESSFFRYWQEHLQEQVDNAWGTLAFGIEKHFDQLARLG